MEKVVGTLLIVNSLLVAAWLAHEGRGAKVAATVAAVGLFGGAVLLLASRLTELTVRGVGSIKAAAHQASVDADAIAHLRARIEAQGATVDLVAASAADAKRLAEAAAERNNEAAAKLAATDVALARATAGITAVEALAEFTQVVVAAQNDDRQAWDRLHAISREAASPFRAKALQAWENVFDDHSKPFFVSGFTVPWRPGVDPNLVPLAALTRDYESAPVQLRPALLEFISSRSDIPTRVRLRFLLDVMERDESLRAVEYAGRYFASLAGLSLKPMAIDAFKDWWLTNEKNVR